MIEENGAVDQDGPTPLLNKTKAEEEDNTTRELLNGKVLENRGAELSSESMADTWFERVNIVHVLFEK